MNACCEPMVTQWHGCYSPGWGKQDLVPEAFAHPAKLAKGLGRKIVEHALEHGWVKPGDLCADPFGGVATIALALNTYGINYVGCELEPRFVGLGQQNIDQWKRKYGQMPGFGTAIILQGDSRKLCSVIATAGLVVSSPPYAGISPEAHGTGIDLRKNYETYRKSGGGSSYEKFCASRARHQDGYGTSDGQLGHMKEGEPPALIVSSPPYAGNEKSDYLLSDDGKTRARDVKRGFKQGHGCFRGSETYGQTDGQLGAMREGPPPAVIISSPPYNPPMSQDHNGSRGGKRGTTPSEKGAFVKYGNTPGQLEGLPMGDIDAVISSPPYAAIAAGAGGLNSKPGKDGQQSGRSADSASQQADSHYGMSDGQLSTMPEGDVAVVVSSPPFERSIHGFSGFDDNKFKKAQGQNCQAMADGYGFSEGQLGETTGNTFWAAARDIVAQCHHILRPGGMAIWITKDFVRKSKRVPFSDQWQALCEAQGFRLVCRHQAMLVAHHGEQHDIFGEAKQLTTERKSFFRRLAEKKGSPAIDWEDIICMVKA